MEKIQTLCFTRRLVKATEKFGFGVNWSEMLAMVNMCWLGLIIGAGVRKSSMAYIDT